MVKCHHRFHTQGHEFIIQKADAQLLWRWCIRRKFRERLSRKRGIQPCQIQESGTAAYEHQEYAIRSYIEISGNSITQEILMSQKPQNKFSISLDFTELKDGISAVPGSLAVLLVSPFTSSPFTSCLYRFITCVRLSFACKISAEDKHKESIRIWLIQFGDRSPLFL